MANQNRNDNIYPPPSTVKLNYQYINYAIKNPRSLNEWDAFCQNTDWLESSKNYLSTSFSKFKSYPKFWLAFHALWQQYPSKNDFGPKSAPWILNGILAGRTVELKDGNPQGRYGYIKIIKK